jgi:hypothetical protein
VLEQLQRLFAHHTFKNSKRCQTLLRYIVEHNLQERNGNGHLKERTLGIEVFGRDANYDTNSDPVVRTTASEIRKRIAQYYHEPGHENEIRIELPLGSYSAEFYLPSVLPSESEAMPADVTPALALPSDEVPRKPVRKRSAWFRYAIPACILLAVIAAAVGWRALNAPPNSLDEFWSAIAASSAPVQLCVGTWPRRLPASAAPSPSSPAIRSPDPSPANALQAASVAPNMVAWSDLVASSNIIGFLQKLRKGYQIENARVASMNDLTEGPAVLVAAYNNPWTLGITDPLRFHFVRGNSKSWIADRRNPSRQYAQSPGTLPGSVQDYAIVARLFNSTTGQISVVVAGLGAAGTIAASCFVTNPHYMKALTGRLPKGWESKNLEALISVQTVNGEPGAPSVQAVEVW